MAEKEEESKLKMKYPSIQRPGPQFLQKRLQKGVSFRANQPADIRLLIESSLLISLFVLFSKNFLTLATTTWQRQRRRTRAQTSLACQSPS